MCGIAGIHFKKPGAINGPMLERLVDQLLLGIEPRGTDATGIVSVAPNGERTMMSKEALTASDFIKQRPSLGDGPVRTVLLHTRFATQGHQSNNANNHPVLHGTTFVTHNGHINNDDRIFKDNEIQRIGEVDSEAIAALVDKHGFDKVHLALQDLEGGFAIAAVNPIAFPDQLVLAKGKNSPLIFFENPQFIVWASTLEAITEAWGDTLGTPPRPRKFRQLSQGQVYMFNGAVAELLEFKVKEYKPSYTTYSGSNYDHYGHSGHYTSPWLTQKEKDDLCFCGHRRFWHAGAKYDEGCVDKDAKTCACTEFLSVAGHGGTSLEKCDGCSAWFNSDDMNNHQDTYSLCDDCEQDWGHYFAEAMDPTAVVVDGVVVSEEDVSCDAQARTAKEPTTVITPSTTVNRRLELVAGPSSREKWQPLFEEGDELVRHNFILGKAADKTGFNPEFIEWILFRSTMDVVNNDAWLQTAHEECDEAYADVEKELNAIEDEIGTERLKAEVILH